MPISTAAAAPVARATAIGPAPASQPLQLVLPAGRARCRPRAQLAQAVSTPGSPQYGHYESIAAARSPVRRLGGTRARVVRYLRAAGATGVKIDATGLFADATMTAARAERLFATPLTHVPFEPAQSVHGAAVPVRRPARRSGGVVNGVIGLDTQALSGPRRADAGGLARKAHVASQPTSAFPRTGTPSGCHAGLSAGELGSDPATAGFTPNQYLTAYGFQQLQAAGLGGEGERVALIEIDGFKLSDIKAFAQCFGLHFPPVNAFGVGVKHPLAPGGESTLDLEVLDAAAPDLKAIDVYETNSSAADTLKAMTAPLQNHGRQPEVISASLGLCEPAVYAAIGVHGIEATEAALEMPPASGITFLASSGDSGSADCIGLDGFPIDRLAVNYPASSSWVDRRRRHEPAAQRRPIRSTNQIVWNDTGDPARVGGGWRL